MQAKTTVAGSLALLAGLGLAVAAGGLAGATAGEKSKNETMGPETGVALLMPIMNPARGRMLFASKGCVVCHSINGVGGTDAPKLDFSRMGKPVMNPFDFVAKMWRGAPAMIAMQEHEIGHQIEFTGEELADIVAFAHDPAEQKKFTKKDIPPKIRKMMDED